VSDHYTAILKIVHVTGKPEPTPGMNRLVAGSDKKKENREVISLTIRADSIDALIEKATGHLALVEDTNGD